MQQTVEHRILSQILSLQRFCICALQRDLQYASCLGSFLTGRGSGEKGEGTRKWLGRRHTSNTGWIKAGKRIDPSELETLGTCPCNIPNFFIYKSGTEMSLHKEPLVRPLRSFLREPFPLHFEWTSSTIQKPDSIHHFLFAGVDVETKSYIICQKNTIWVPTLTCPPLYPSTPPYRTYMGGWRWW